MKRIICLGIASLGIPFPSLADKFRLEGETFSPSCPIIWKVTNQLPSHVTVYRIAEVLLAHSAISNALSIASFKPINLVRTGDKSMMLFQDNPDRTHMSRFLKILPSQGLIDYYNAKANQLNGTGVPSFDEAEKLAVAYFVRLGGDTNQVAAKPWRRTEQTVTSLEHQGGRETNKVVSVRGVFLFREIDGIQEPGSSFWIDFASNAKPFMFNFIWPALELVKRHKAGSQSEVINWINAGLAVIPKSATYAPESSPDKSARTPTEKLVITKAELYYSEPVGPNRELFPFAQLEVVAQGAGTNQTNFIIQCPLIHDE